MDVTIGSGWSYGGPYITPDLAAARLRSERREITPDRTSVPRPVPYDGDRLVAAFIGRGSMQEADPRTFRELDLAGDGPIALPAGNGPRVVLFYFASHSGQIVKRAALGAEGYVLDHFSRPAIETHLREAGDKLLGAAGPGGVHAIFCDSLEVYDADWTADLLEQFRSRRGYDLRPLLPLWERDAGDRSLEVRRDVGRTLSELYEERFLVPLAQWAKKNNVLLRIQNYGEPPATISSSRHADLIDGEGWKFRELTSSRWASSASHLFGRPVTTSETWTWLHSPAFRATPLDVKAEADQHFLAGINQLIGHGWPYSPPQAGTPGWPFYAAAVLSDKNPWWPVMPDLAAYLHRVSFVLRQGEPVVDVALYAPTEDSWAAFRPGASMNLFRKIVELVGPNVVPAILAAGHAFDLVDDGSIEEIEARHYKAIVLPGVRFVPEGRAVSSRTIRRPAGWCSPCAASPTAIGRHSTWFPRPTSRPAWRRRRPGCRLAASGHRRRVPPSPPARRGRLLRGQHLERAAHGDGALPFPDAARGAVERLHGPDGANRRGRRRRRAHARALRHARRRLPGGCGRSAGRPQDIPRRHGGPALGMDGELRRSGERRDGGPSALLGGRCRAQPLLGHRDLCAPRHLGARFPEARR
jgi:hypothetical protein